MKLTSLANYMLRDAYATSPSIVVFIYSSIAFAEEETFSMTNAAADFLSISVSCIVQV